MPVRPLPKLPSVFHNFIGGQYVPAKNGHQFAVKSPSTNLIIGHCADSSVEDASDAIAAAHKAFPSWSSTLAKDRANMLNAWAHAMHTNRTHLAQVMAHEMGKPVKEAAGEVVYAASFLEWFAGEAVRAYGETIPSPKAGTHLFTIKEAVGPVAAITPWNFPLAMITRKIGAAIAAGCTTVVKPAHLSPLSCHELVRLAADCSLPPGVVNVVTVADEKRTPMVGQKLVTDDRIAKITFTGSTAAGARLAEQAAGNIKRASMELGGNAPFVVLADADVDAAASGAVTSRFRNAGQTCVCANRFLVHEDVHDAFVDAVVSRVRRMKVGDPLHNDTDIGCLVSPTQRDRVRKLVDDAVSRGARVVIGGSHAVDASHMHDDALFATISSSVRRGEGADAASSPTKDGMVGGRWEGEGGSPAASPVCDEVVTTAAEVATAPLEFATYMMPTVVVDVPPDCALAQEEVFGPVLAVQKITSEDDAVARANDSDHGLAGYLYTQNIGAALRVAKRLEIGMVGVNEPLVSSEVAPFGGVKKSGYGREGSCHGLQEYMSIKSVIIGGL
eukprot:TRINITY_DN20757_c0_g1_i1.p1 TRINITY_DN20757_c0_g1~~TRINITY_DN20757_c0_g1_i1.p1  ORF type:complete len:558 (+),score=150.88 TRINITY_DN20757_c0_g1_i1:95-1768(+)